MEILLLSIYSFFVWLIFFKFRLLPWNIVSQVITITIPIIGIACLILFLNIYAPSSHDVRVVNYPMFNTRNYFSRQNSQIVGRKFPSGTTSTSLTSYHHLPDANWRG